MSDHAEQPSNILTLPQNLPPEPLSESPILIRTIPLKAVTRNARTPKYRMGQTLYAKLDLADGDDTGADAMFLEVTVTGVICDFDYVGYHLGMLDAHGNLTTDDYVVDEEKLFETPSSINHSLPSKRPRLTLVSSRDSN